MDLPGQKWWELRQGVGELKLGILLWGEMELEGSERNTMVINGASLTNQVYSFLQNVHKTNRNVYVLLNVYKVKQNLYMFQYVYVCVCVLIIMCVSNNVQNLYQNVYTSM